MFIPFLTKRNDTKQDLYRRKGGGGGGKGGGSSGGGKGGGSSGGGKGGGSTGGSSSGGKPSSGGGSTSGGRPNSIPIAGKTPVGKGSATTYGGGGGKVTTIPSGSAFGGRTAGGGTRGQVFGSSTYGSGYPGISGRGVSGRGFPFYFWPIVWGSTAGGASGGYLHDSGEYGDPSNSSRPGGAMTQANFVSNSTGTLFYLLADNSTVAALITTIDANCTSYLALSSSSSPVPYNSSDANAPQPEEAVEYYRASSVVLALNGYNNSAVFSSDANVPNSPLPSGIDTNLLNCLNQTIGVSVPLVNGAMSAWATSAGPKVSAIGMFWVLWFVLGNMM